MATLDPVLKNQVWVIKPQHGLKARECDELLEKANSIGFKPSQASGGGRGQVSRLQLARTSKVAVLEDEAYANALFQRLRKLLPPDLSFMVKSPSFSTIGSEDGTDWKLCGLVDRLRFYRYDKGDEYPEHQDGCYKRRVVTEQGDQFVQQSFLTLLFYLNDDFTGGETRFWDESMKNCRFLHGDESRQLDKSKTEPVDVQPEKGKICLQLHMLYHKGCPVTSDSSKFIMRTDVLFEKKLKTNPKIKPKPGVSEWEKLFEPSCKNYHD